MTERGSSTRGAGRGEERRPIRRRSTPVAARLNLPIDGTAVIGEGEMDEAPTLFIGEKVGAAGGFVDIAVDPLEGTTLCAKNMPGAIATIAIAEGGTCCTRPTSIWTRSRSGPAILRT